MSLVPGARQTGPVTTTARYRPSAVAHLSDPEQLDTAVRITRPRGWIALSAVGLVLAAFVAWCLLGSVQTTFPGAGVLLTPGGTGYAVSIEGGQIDELRVTVGQEVREGEVVATVRTAAGRVSDLEAPTSGRVSELLAYPTDAVAPGAAVVTIQRTDEQLRAFIWVAVDASQPIRPGMPVQISVTTAPSEEFGLLRGTVRTVGAQPATRAGVDALLNNDDLTTTVVGSGAPVFQIEVELDAASTPTGYAWTSGGGPRETLTSGTLVNASVITAVRAPITLLFPSARVTG